MDLIYLDSMIIVTIFFQRNTGPQNVAHVAPSPSQDGRRSPRAGIVHPTVIDHQTGSAADGNRKRFSPSQMGFQPIRDGADTGFDVPGAAAENGSAKLPGYNNIQVPQIGKYLFEFSP